MSGPSSRESTLLQLCPLGRNRLEELLVQPLANPRKRSRRILTAAFSSIAVVDSCCRSSAKCYLIELCLTSLAGARKGHLVLSGRIVLPSLFEDCFRNMN